jgi:hypothetical protein
MLHLTPLRPTLLDVVWRKWYGGRLEDAFPETSLHMSFTGWSMQVDTSSVGFGTRDVDKEAQIFEALVSVHERGRWIADLDVLKATSKACHYKDHEFYFKVSCDHEHHDGSEISSIEEPIMIITSWEELLDFFGQPQGPALVLTHGNWMARLAVSSLAVLKGTRVFLNNGFCQGCYKRLQDDWPVELVDQGVVPLLVCRSVTQTAQKQKHLFEL